MKWVRVAYWDAPLQWHYVEQEKGKYVIDPRTDEAVTETVENGCNITLCLCYGNWLYAPNPKRNMAERIWVIPHDPPPTPTTPEMLEGFLNFTRFMVKHFKDRIRYYEIWNEPNGHYAWPTGPNVKEFCDFAKKVAPVIKEVYPEAKVVMGAVGGPGRRGDKGCWLHGFVDEGIENVHLVVFLASPLSDHITGQFIEANSLSHIDILPK